jgi:hypothetical protein
MPAPKKNVAGYIAKQVAKKIVKKPVVKLQPKPNLKADPKSNVKIVKSAKTKQAEYDAGAKSRAFSEKMRKLERLSSTGGSRTFKK